MVCGYSVGMGELVDMTARSLGVQAMDNLMFDEVMQDNLTGEWNKVVP